MKEDKVYLKHVLDEINFLLKETKNLSYQEFIENEVYTRAFSRSLEIIGEAVKNLSKKLRDKHNEIEWKKIACLRDKLVHHYFAVDYNLMWDVIKNKLPDIKPKISSIIKTE